MNLQKKKTLDYLLGTLLLVLLRPVVRIVARILNRDNKLDARGDIYFIKMQGGGSLVLALPALLGIRRHFPNNRLCLVTVPSVAVYGRLLGVFDEVLIIDESSPLKLLVSSFRVLAGAIGRVDHFVDLEVYSRLTTVFSVFSCARIRIGFYLESTYWREHSYNYLIFFNRYSPVYVFYERIATLLGAEPASLADCRHSMEQTLPKLEHSSDSPHGEFSRQAGSIGLACCCSDFGRERMLSPAQWVKVLSSRLPAETTVKFTFFGAKGDAPFCEEVRQALHEAFPQAKFENLCGKHSLSTSVSLLQTLDSFYSIDSGLLHCTRLLGVRCISYWGPTDPETRLKPMPELEEEVFYHKIACSPCIHQAENPPCLGENACISELTENLADAQSPVPVIMVTKIGKLLCSS